MTKIALIQQPASGSRGANINKGVAATREAAGNGANLLCFSELAFDRFYPAQPAGPDRDTLAKTIPGPTTDVFTALARELEVVIVLNFLEMDGGKTFDSSPVIDADGAILGSTRMVHVPDYPCFHEKGYYTPGDRGAAVYDTAIGRIGVAICYDRHYPEYMRALAVAGAGQAFHFQRHQTLCREADHLTQHIGVGTLLKQRTKGHHVVGHRGLLWSGLSFTTQP